MGLKEIFLLNLYYLNCSKSHFTNCQTMLEKPKMNKYTLLWIFNSFNVSPSDFASIHFITFIIC